MASYTTLRRAAFVLGAVGGVILAAGPAMAYVGPGAGLTLVGSLVALIVAGAVVLAGLVLFPLRMALKRRRAAKQADEGVEADAG